MTGSHRTFAAAAVSLDRGARPRVVFVINRYRTYDHRMYATLADAFDLHVVWIHPPPADEPVPPSLPMRWTVIDDNPKIITPRDVRRNAMLFRTVTALGRGADLIVASTSDSWKARVVYAAARALGVPIALRKEKWRDRGRWPRGLRGLYWQFQRRVTDHMERNAVGMLVGGSRSEAYLVDRGVPEEQILPFRYLHPDLGTLPLDRSVVDKLREMKGKRIAFLYLGRLMHQKGLMPLLRAFRTMLATGRDAVLFVVGEAIAHDDGRGRVSVDYADDARRLAAGEPRIVFLGKAAPTAVNSYYAAADVFVHPHVASVDGRDVHEGWGQVITEAASMSLPIITTDRVASGHDIVIAGETGVMIHAEWIDVELPNALATFVDRPELARQMGRNARARFEVFVDPGINIEALRRLIGRGRR